MINCEYQVVAGADRSAATSCHGHVLTVHIFRTSDSHTGRQYGRICFAQLQVIFKQGFSPPTAAKCRKRVP